MSYKSIVFLIVIVILIQISCSKQDNFPILKAPYFGQKPPGMTPEIFAPGVVSTTDVLEMGCTWTPEGREFYFARSEMNDVYSNWAIWGMRETDGVWSEPQILDFSGVYRDFAPFMTPDGKYMLFYRMSSDEAETRQGTWIVEHEGDAWGEQRFFVDAYCLTTQDFRTFYFTTERSEETSKDIGRMNLENGVFSEPTKLEGGLNSEEWEAHGSISPDGSFIIFDRVESTFVSFRKDDNTWSRGYDLGVKFHIPSVSPDGKYLFFESKGDIYWVDAKVIEDLKPDQLQ